MGHAMNADRASTSKSGILPPVLPSSVFRRLHGGITAFVLLLGSFTTAWATPLGDDLLAPAAPRPAPRSRPEIAPRPAIFTSRSLVYAARSADGSWIATVEKGDDGDELWLQPTGNSLELPRLLWSSPVRMLRL